MRSLRRQLEPSIIKEMASRYASGEAIRALSREFGVSRDGLWHLLQRHGVTLRPRGMTPEDAERAAALYESGLTIRQVVEKVGYSYGTVRSALHKQGVILQPGKRLEGVDRIDNH